MNAHTPCMPVSSVTCLKSQMFFNICGFLALESILEGFYGKRLYGELSCTCQQRNACFYVSEHIMCMENFPNSFLSNYLVHISRSKKKKVDEMK